MPTFWFPTFRYLCDNIIKWLPCPLRQYIDGPVPPITNETEWIRSGGEDMDQGEMYLNYVLHLSDRHAFGIKMQRELSDGRNITIFRRCSRLMFGAKPAPYGAVQMHVRALEIIQGDRHDPKNAFQWDHVAVNWPFERDYDPSLPRVMRIRKDGNIASNVPTYMDDGR